MCGLALLVLGQMPRVRNTMNASEEYGITNWRFARPQSQQLTFSGLQDDLKKSFESWRWVALTDLEATLRSHLRMFTSWDFPQSVSILSRFALVNRRVADVGLMTWTSRLGWSLHSTDLPTGPAHSIYIPEGWSDKIVGLVEQGVVEVGLQPPKPTHGVVIHDLEARFFDGRKHWLHWQGGDKYRVIYPGM